jgi:hypothetical protein
MNLVEKLNTLYTVKFVDKLEVIERGDRRFFILETFDEKKFLFKQYLRSSNNATKLKESNNAVHLLTKQDQIFADYVYSKEFDSITNIEDSYLGTLYNYDNGVFLSREQIQRPHLKSLAEVSNKINDFGYSLYENSFTIRQTESIFSVVSRSIEKLRDELEENDIHHFLSNKLGLRIDRDLFELNLAHVEQLNTNLKKLPSTILNMDNHFDNITFKPNSSEVQNVYFDRIYVGNPLYQTAKTISRLSVYLKTGYSDLKKLFKPISPSTEMDMEYLDSLICFYLIDMLYKFYITEAYKDKEEAFSTLQNKLVKEKVLTYA